MTTDDDLELDKAAKKLHLHPLARLAGGLFLALPVGSLVFLALYHQNAKVEEAAVELCAKPPPCEGDTMEIAYARGRRHVRTERGMVRTGPGLVLYRRSADCSRRVEVYHDADGHYLFRGSSEDPDPVERASFLAERRRWLEGHHIVSTVPCDRVDEL